MSLPTDAMSDTVGARNVEPEPLDAVVCWEGVEFQPQTKNDHGDVGR